MLRAIIAVLIVGVIAASILEDYLATKAARRTDRRRRGDQWSDFHPGA
jgi:hypothetical protein